MQPDVCLLQGLFRVMLLSMSVFVQEMYSADEIQSVLRGTLRLFSQPIGLKDMSLIDRSYFIR